ARRSGTDTRAAPLNAARMSSGAQYLAPVYLSRVHRARRRRAVRCDARLCVGRYVSPAGSRLYRFEPDTGGDDHGCRGGWRLRPAGSALTATAVAGNRLAGLDGDLGYHDTGLGGGSRRGVGQMGLGFQDTAVRDLRSVRHPVPGADRSLRPDLRFFAGGELCAVRDKDADFRRRLRQQFGVAAGQYRPVGGRFALDRLPHGGPAGCFSIEAQPTHAAPETIWLG